MPDTARTSAGSLCLALYQPDIPQNCGTMLRLCACLGLDAAIIELAGFPTSARHFRRASAGRRLVLLTTRTDLAYTAAAFAPGDILMVGRESAGVPDAVHVAADLAVTVPMRPPARSLNVAVAAAMVVGEALRQVEAHHTIKTIAKTPLLP